jgi:hypothetical protein
MTTKTGKYEAKDLNRTIHHMSDTPYFNMTGIKVIVKLAERNTFKT